MDKLMNSLPVSEIDGIPCGLKEIYLTNDSNKELDKIRDNVYDISRSYDNLNFKLNIKINESKCYLYNNYTEINNLTFGQAFQQYEN